VKRLYTYRVNINGMNHTFAATTLQKALDMAETILESGEIAAISEMGEVWVPDEVLESVQPRDNNRRRRDDNFN
jgi:hypothetical protein